MHPIYYVVVARRHDHGQIPRQGYPRYLKPDAADQLIIHEYQIRPDISQIVHGINF